jgi:hypothetical protein
VFVKIPIKLAGPCRIAKLPFDNMAAGDIRIADSHGFRRRMMLRRLLACGLVLVGVSVLAIAAEKHEHSPAATKNAGLDKLKTLVGTWVMADKDGKPTEDVVSVIKLTAGGSAIHETLFPGQPHEMVSIYTADGPDVLMTHYCMLGNQPRMKASTKGITNKLNFEFAGGTNLDPKKDKHMHAATLTIVDADHYEVDGIGWEDGAPAKEMCNGMKLIRKK